MQIAQCTFKSSLSGNYEHIFSVHSFHTDIKVCTFDAMGVCFADELHKVYSFRVSQLRIRIEKDYSHDAVINEIAVFTYNKDDGADSVAAKKNMSAKNPAQLLLAGRKAYDKVIADVMASRMAFFS